MANGLVAVLSAARAAGVALRIGTDGELKLSADDAPSMEMVAELKRYREDIVLLCRAAAEHNVGLAWCAEQLGEHDYPAELGYPCLAHFIRYCIDRENLCGMTI